LLYFGSITREQENECSLNEIPSRQVLVDVLEEWSLIKHQKLEAELALKIADRVSSDGIKIEKDLVYAAALLHDFGLTIYFGGHVPWHNLIGADLLRELGFPDAITRCIECHFPPATMDEMNELQFPPRLVTRDTIPRTWEEKIVSFSDITGRVVGMDGRDIWADPKAPGNAMFNTLNGWYEKYAGHSISREHSILQRANTLVQEIKNYCRPIDFVGLERWFPPGVPPPGRENYRRRIAGLNKISRVIRS
jgi:putative nucleotidyltransferase with HDIG domain